MIWFIKLAQNEVVTISKRHTFRLKSKPVASGNENIQHSNMITGKYICNILCLLNKITIVIQVFLKLPLKEFWGRYTSFFFPSNPIKQTYFNILIFKELKCFSYYAVKSIKDKNAKQTRQSKELWKESGCSINLCNYSINSYCINNVLISICQKKAFSIFYCAAIFWTKTVL